MIVEELHVVLARIEVISYVRRNYASPACEEGALVTPPPASLLPRSKASPRRSDEEIISE